MDEYTDYAQFDSRTTQQGIIPSAVKLRNLSRVVLKTGTAATGAIPTINGQRTVLQITVTSSKGADLFVPEYYIGLYAGSVDNAHRIPGGSAIVDTDWYVTGPMYDYNLWQQTRDTSVIIISIVNISGGATNLYFFGIGKYFAPAEGSI